MHQYKNVICLVTLISLQACSGAGVAPVANRGEVKETPATTSQRSSKSSVKPAKPKAVQNKSGYHIVSEGDTLYSIAWRYNFDYKQVASWNQVKAPYTIYPGQLIRLKPVLKKKGVALKKPQASTKKNVVKQPLPEKKPAPVKKPVKKVAKKTTVKPALPKGPVKWYWPTDGKIARTNSPTSKKGLDILGRAGQRVKAAASGEVVYSGGGLLGYGKLIIIKHNETYLSAYAYNSKLLVKEGDRVKAGENISEMGQDHTGRTVLHFEIRKNGKPTNPSRYLPKKRA
ncbi:MAG: peptidoglycan DD-metalloendopeptidase family protein [Proteobacteria bacterium]|nr:LysM peptidoglycan-binding domain-containing protein [Pseudomonadota bacterium]NOG59172.1 peptidoglycan DD-metalloendopeptidase family protein [Pseudomonadota bacterium]